MAGRSKAFDTRHGLLYILKGLFRLVVLATGIAQVDPEFSKLLLGKIANLRGQLLQRREHFFGAMLDLKPFQPLRECRKIRPEG